LGVLNDADQIGCIGQVAIMQHEPRFLFVRVLIKMIDAGGAALDAMESMT